MVKLFTVAHESDTGAVEVLYCGTNPAKAVETYKSTSKPGRLYHWSKPQPDRTRRNPVAVIAQQPKQEQSKQSASKPKS